MREVKKNISQDIHLVPRITTYPEDPPRRQLQHCENYF